MADSLADDEATLRMHASRFLTAAEAALPKWIEHCVISRTSAERFEEDTLLLAATNQAQIDAERTVIPKLRVLLQLDIERQRSTPLEVFRKAVPFPTRVLELAGVDPVARDEFATRQFPRDVYGLTPMSLREVHEDLHEPGIIWGAAKAHVHLRRRREAGEPETGKVAAYAPSLLDRGKILGALAAPHWVTSPATLVESDADLVIVDLTKLRDPSVLADIDGWTIGYGPHKQAELLDAAREAGCDEVLPRSVFFRRLEQGQITVRNQ